MRAAGLDATLICMNSFTHLGHVDLAGAQFGATLTLQPGRLTLEVASAGDMPNLPERLDLVTFTSNTGYFTLINLFRRTHNMRFGVASLSTYDGGLAFESAHFGTRDQIRSGTWSMHVGDIAKILHVNGVLQQMIFPDEVDVDMALRSMHRIRQLLSLVMGRVLPITSASMKLSQDGNPKPLCASDRSRRAGARRGRPLGRHGDN